VSRPPLALRRRDPLAVFGAQRSFPTTFLLERSRKAAATSQNAPYLLQPGDLFVNGSDNLAYPFNPPCSTAR
jgi:hypothetical protein